MEQEGVLLMTSRMTATDELRRLLDERGIEYEPIDSVRSPNRRTLWGKVERGKGILGLDAKYETIEFKKGMRLTISDCSPAQAVEATLGRGTCRFIDEDNFNETEGCDAYSWFRCSACGWMFDECDRWLTTMSYCPNCGRKVRA